MAEEVRTSDWDIVVSCWIWFLKPLDHPVFLEHVYMDPKKFAILLQV